MALAKIIGAQRDFSAGELDVAMKRADDHPIMKIGARQLANFRVLNSGAAINRPGRTAFFPTIAGRCDVVLMYPGQFFVLAFGAGTLGVYNAAGTLVFASNKLGDGVTNIPWTLATVKNIVFAVTPPPRFNIYIAYGDGAPANPPQILSWDGVSQTSTWTLSTFAETIVGGGQKRTLFYRLSPPNITLQPSAVTGVVNIAFSSNVLVAGMVGTRLRYANRQIQIKTVTNGMNGTATVIEPLPPSQTLTVSGTQGQFNVGDAVLGSVTGAEGIVISGPSQEILNSNSVPNGAIQQAQIGDFLTGGTSGATGTVVNAFFSSSSSTWWYVVQLATSTTFSNGETVTGGSVGSGSFVIFIAGSASLVVQLLATTSNVIIEFTTSDKVVGPSGSATVTGVSTGAPQAIAVWDNEVMNLFRGFPTSVFFDQSRLGFCNFPPLPSAIAWSAIGLPTDLYVGALPAQAIFELAPGQSQVFFVQPGLEGSEFVFCDNAVYYIPITPANPLIPGTVAFNQISAEGCSPNVQPRQASQSIVYMKFGGLKVGAVQVPGAYYRPYVIDDVSEYHSHLFTASPVIAIAIPPAPLAGMEELYIYLARADGQLIVGKYQIRNGLLDVGPDGKPKIGWLPWNSGTQALGTPGVASTTWVAAIQGFVLFTSFYSPNGVTPVTITELIDNTKYLDGTLTVMSVTGGPFTPPGGKGPLFVFPGPGGSVSLMDQGNRSMGTYQIDANGFIIPQGNAGENLNSATLVAGQPWVSVLEPFAPEAQPGQDIHQRMYPRRVSRMAVYVSQSTGFDMVRWFSGPLTRTSPALGTVMNFRRVATWNQDDDPTKPPPLREETQRWRPLGRSYDPRVGVAKDTPGPLIVHEIGMELTV